MRVYISGKITGTNDYLDRFAKAEGKLSEQGIDVINPARLLNGLPKMSYEDCMKVCMCLMDLADSIHMLKGWEKSTGANREYGYALAKGMHITAEE